MILVIGGAYQGKCRFVKDTFHVAKEEMVDGSSCEKVIEGKGIYHLEEYIKRLLNEGQDAKTIVLEQIKRKSNLIVICNEMGCGLVPVDAFDRNYREVVGRIQCELAKIATEVFRVYCGIGAKLK